MLGAFGLEGAAADAAPESPAALEEEEVADEVVEEEEEEAVEESASAAGFLGAAALLSGLEAGLSAAALEAARFAGFLRVGISSRGTSRPCKQHS